jgi:4-amino-4-deoxychorismate lyase
LNESRKALFEATDEIFLETVIQVPGYAMSGIFKCRVIYGRKIEQVEFIPYVLPRVARLKAVMANDIEYSHKFLDRSRIMRLLESRGGCDEILIVRGGYMTDTSFTNIALFDGTAWFTPSSPLLPGTKRQALIDMGVLRPADLTLSDVHRFSRISLINSMLDIDQVTVDSESIVF